MTENTTTAAPAATRTPTDYALEFAEYLARGAEHLIEAVCADAGVRLRIAESDDVDDDTEHDAQASVDEALRSLRERIGQFRARRDRALSAPAAHGMYSIDADPDGIRARAADAIMGTLAFGAQGNNRPPEGHWLTPFWEAAHAEVAARARLAPAAQEAEPTGCRISDPDGETSTKTALEIADDLMAEATMAANRANVSSDDYDISTTVRIAATTLRRQSSRIAELVAEPAASQAPAAALEQAWRAGWAACRDAEYVGEEAEDWAWGASATNSLAIDIEQSAPAAAVAPVAEEMLQALQLVASKLESRPYGTGSYIPKPIREKVHAAIARARQEGGGA